MIRLTYLLRRKPGTSLEDFQRYWLDVHGPLIASHASHLNILRCMQVRTLDAAAGRITGGTRAPMEEPYDGVGEIWWESREALARALETPAGEAAAAAILEDERGFIDLPHSPLWLAYEYPQVNPVPEDLIARERSSVVKFYYPLRHRPELTIEEVQLYWRTNHGPIIRSQAAGSGILRYVQVHRFEDPLEDLWRRERGTVTETYTGHAELWFDRSNAAPTPERQAGEARAIEDERTFIDFARSSMWFAKERVVIDRR
jgi:uncharacterized protein (TIGR02118 family)